MHGFVASPQQPVQSPSVLLLTLTSTMVSV
jgi:hypothetical protein